MPNYYPFDNRTYTPEGYSDDCEVYSTGLIYEDIVEAHKQLRSAGYSIGTGSIEARSLGAEICSFFKERLKWIHWKHTRNGKREELQPD